MKTILTAITCFLITLTACLAATNAPPEPAKAYGISVETLGALRIPEHGKSQWGAGVGVAYSANRFLDITGRLLAYESPDDWRGSTVDEANVGVRARVLGSERLNLAAVGGVNYAFDDRDWGLSLGARGTAYLYEGLYLFAQAEWQLWDRDNPQTQTKSCSAPAPKPALSQQGILITTGFGWEF